MIIQTQIDLFCDLCGAPLASNDRSPDIRHGKATLSLFIKPCGCQTRRTVGRPRKDD